MSFERRRILHNLLDRGKEMKSSELFQFVKNLTFIAFYWCCLEKDCHKKTEENNNACKDEPKIHIQREWSLNEILKT